MEVVAMIKFFSKIYNQCGIGSSHVITRTGNPMLKLWGIWTPYFTVLFSKIFAIKQIPHNHEGSFISFLLWGSYTEVVNGIATKKKWINKLSHNQFHEIKANKPVYTLMFMGVIKNKITSGIVNNKVIPSNKIVRGYK